MSFKLLDTVVLARDLPEHDLRRGDLGTVVELYPPDGALRGVEVEFATVAGRTIALVSLSKEDVRPIGDFDLPTVRTLSGRSA